MSNRNDIRQAIFDKIACRAKQTVEILGTTIEVVQPTVKEMLELSTSGVAISVTEILIRFAYVPGTDTQVFEVADREMLDALPFTSDIQRIFDVFNNFSAVNVTAAEKN